MYLASAVVASIPGFVRFDKVVCQSPSDDIPGKAL
jgi:hypothetical protein